MSFVGIQKSLSQKRISVSQMKRIGVIGPTNATLIENKVGLSDRTLEGATREISTFLAKNSFALACVPARGVGLWALESYKNARGTDSLALTPTFSGQTKDSLDETHRNALMADRVRDDLTWGEEPFELARISDCLVVLGLSCGTMIEMVATKWIKNTPVLAVRSLMTGIPAEIAVELDLRICDTVDSLKGIIGETLADLDKDRTTP